MSYAPVAFALILAQVPPAEISAPDLWFAFQENTAASEIRYAGKSLHVRGQVQRISKLSSGEFVVMLRVFDDVLQSYPLGGTPPPPPPPERRGVYCLFREAGAVSQLATNLYIEVRGGYADFANGRLELRCLSAEVVPQPKPVSPPKPSEKKKPPVKTAPAKRQPPSLDPEQVAATRLNFARILLEDGKRNDAVFRLERLIKDLPQTKAAAEAQTLLGNLKR